MLGEVPAVLPSLKSNLNDMNKKQFVGKGEIAKLKRIKFSEMKDRSKEVCIYRKMINLEKKLQVAGYYLRDS